MESSIGTYPFTLYYHTNDPEICVQIDLCMMPESAIRRRSTHSENHRVNPLMYTFTAVCELLLVRSLTEKSTERSANR